MCRESALRLAVRKAETAGGMGNTTRRAACGVMAVFTVSVESRRTLRALALSYAGETCWAAIAAQQGMRVSRWTRIPA
eukprot:3921937-Prymnesium_polylepis.3